MSLTLAAVFVLVVIAVLGAMPVGALIAGVAVLVIIGTFDGNFSLFGNGIWNFFNSFAFTAVPVFIFMGDLLAESGLAGRAYRAIAPVLERFPGKLVQSNIGACALFSAVSGSSTATTAVIGSLAHRELKDRGYRSDVIAGSVAAGGTLGILIPPSVALIIYGAWQQVSVGALFGAAVMPGLMLVAAFMLYIGIRASLDDSFVPNLSTATPKAGVAALFRDVAPLIALSVGIIASIVAGIATPTEAAALGAVGAIILGRSVGDLTLAGFARAVMSTVRMFGALTLVFVGAVMLSQAAGISGLPEALVSRLTGLELSATVTMLLIYAVYLLLGTVLGPVEMLLVTLPFVYPVVMGLGYDPVWFGVVLVIVIEIGLLTPPVGINLFVAVAAADNSVTLMETARACLPYWLLMLACLMLLTLAPQLVLWIPGLL